MPLNMEPSNTKAEPANTFRFTAIGTNWQIDTESALPDQLRTEILTLTEDFDQVWSRFRPDSTVTEIAHAPGGGRYAFPARDVPLLELYDRLVAATEGAVNPLVGRDLELLGYDAHYTLAPDVAGLAARVPDVWTRDVRREGAVISTERPVVIDVGAAGKGYLVDLMAHLLVDARIGRFVVDGSGDLRHAGSEPLLVGLEHPTRSHRVIGTVPVQNGALCASTTTRRAWGEDLHHVLDGRTGKPVSAVVAVWVMASDAATADGIATALFVADPATLDPFEFSWVRMLSDGRVQWSDNFPGELFI